MSGQIQLFPAETKVVRLSAATLPLLELLLGKRLTSFFWTARTSQPPSKASPPAADPFKGLAYEEALTRVLNMMRHQCKLRWYMLGALERDFQRQIGGSRPIDLEPHINELIARGLVRKRSQVPLSSHTILVPPEFSGSLGDFYRAVPSEEQALVQARIFALYQEARTPSVAAIKQSYIAGWGSEHLFRHDGSDVIDFGRHVELLMEDAKLLSTR